MDSEVKKEMRWALFQLMGYSPTEGQRKFHFYDLEDETNRIKELVGGEQSGKSLATAREVITRAISEGGELYWLCGVDYSIPRKEFEYILEDGKTLCLVDPKSIVLNKDLHRECSVELVLSEKEPAFVSGQYARKAKRVKILTKSFKDIVKAMTKESPDGIAVCEAAQTDWGDIERCLTRMAASRGWLVLSGTMEGSQNWYSSKYKEWQVPNKEGGRSFSMPSWANIHVYPQGQDDPEFARIRAILPEDKFMERFAAIPCPSTRLTLPEFRNEVHVGNYPFNPEEPVELAVDPGYAGAYAVEVIQCRADVVYLVDEVYVQGYTTEQVIDICLLKPWWKNVKGGVIDIAAKQHQAMEAPVEVWYKRTGLHLRTHKVDLNEGINRLRSFLKKNPISDRPQLLVNHISKGFISECDGCKPVVEGGGAWLRDKYTNEPLRRNNHASMSIIYYLVDRFGYVAMANKTPVGSVHGFNPFI